jgi:hypothetical protein
MKIGNNCKMDENMKAIASRKGKEGCNHCMDLDEREET